MKLIYNFITLCLSLLSTITYSQKPNEFSGKWCHDLENMNYDCWRINLEKNQMNGTSSLNVMDNQLSYDCTNKLKGDTLFFYFQNSDAGMGGISLINNGKIKIPQKGKLIGKAVLSSGQLKFVYKAKKMDLGDLYNLAQDN
jgi:hypothetical protein